MGYSWGTHILHCIGGTAWRHLCLFKHLHIHWRKIRVGRFPQNPRQHNPVPSAWEVSMIFPLQSFDMGC